MIEKKSWRDVYKVHPAADLFPMLPEDELRKLGEDIKGEGLREPIVFWRPGYHYNENQPTYLLDGRNRLAAMELVGVDLKDEDKCYLYGKSNYGTKDDNFDIPPTDPYSYNISKNIRRRHLTKEQQADSLVKVVMAKTDLAKMAKSVERNSKGQVQGRTKDAIKQAVVEDAKKHDVDLSKRTIERSIAKAKGPTHTAPRKKAEPKPPSKSNLSPGMQDNYPPKVPTDTPKPTSDPRVNGGEKAPAAKFNAAATAKKIVALMEMETKGASQKELEELLKILNKDLTACYRRQQQKAFEREVTASGATLVKKADQVKEKNTRKAMEDLGDRLSKVMGKDVTVQWGK